ncbi:MAG: hypothetical protein Q7S21_07800 [archaeon]|nr:hypothetical protein [archaeon]
MRFSLIGLILITFLFLGGCVNVNFDKTNNNAVCGNNVCEEFETPLTCPKDCSTVSSQENANPTISNISASPSNPGIGQVFVLKVTAVDDKAISHIFWKSSKPLQTMQNGSLLSADFFECDLQPTCSQALQFKSEEAGLIEINVYATDSTGRETAKTKMEINVQSFREDTAFAVCGNNSCEQVETLSNCPADCTLANPICGNAECEAGESFETCSVDCSVISGLGNVCGNNICESGETSTSCSVDCAAPSNEDECNSNSDCEYKEICRGGNCIAVECTTKSQCGSCESCSENTCRSCGSGPFGCYC